MTASQASFSTVAQTVAPCSRALRALECGGPPQDGFAVANLTPLLGSHVDLVIQCRIVSRCVERNAGLDR
jgi:hypothetical protein